MLVPGRGYNDSIGGIALASDVFALGPIAAGVWLLRLNVTWQCPAATLVTLWVGLGRSSDVDQGAIEAAQSLIGGGRASVFGRRALQLGAFGAGASSMAIHIGRLVHAGPVWVIGQGLAPSDAWELQVSLETVQVVSTEGTESGASE